MPPSAPESPLPSIYFEQLMGRLSARGGRELAAAHELERLWDVHWPIAELWPRIRGLRAYWECVWAGDPELTGLSQFAMTALLVQQGLDARAELLAALTRPYLTHAVLPSLHALAGVCENRETDVGTALRAGMAEHDRGDFAAAISIYESVIERWPNAAWPWYEKAHSTAAIEGKPGEGTRELCDQVLQRDPFYGLAFPFRSERDRRVLSTHIQPFASSGDLAPAVVMRFAEGAMQLGEHWFAAHARVFLGFMGHDPPPQLLLQVSLVELGARDVIKGAGGDGRVRRRGAPRTGSRTRGAGWSRARASLGVARQRERAAEQSRGGDRASRTRPADRGRGAGCARRRPSPRTAQPRERPHG